MQKKTERAYSTQKLSIAVWRYIQARREPGESFDTVLRRVLGIPPKEVIDTIDPKLLKTYLETSFPPELLRTAVEA